MKERLAIYKQRERWQETVRKSHLTSAQAIIYTHNIQERLSLTNEETVLMKLYLARSSLAGKILKIRRNQESFKQILEYIPFGNRIILFWSKDEEAMEAVKKQLSDEAGILAERVPDKGIPFQLKNTANIFMLSYYDMREKKLDIQEITHELDKFILNVKLKRES